MAQDQPHRPVSDAENSPDRPSREQRVEAARAVVYNEEGDLIEREEIETALEEYGVTVGEAEDGKTEYRAVPRELSLSAVHLAVNTRRDPEEFIVNREDLETESANSGT